ncbi:BREX system serine/threonine kinase PglW [Kitasatospora sp. NPDC056731]|uniref:BREX system serine/threonine kinase PglW n=1 Tax=Kitasatospora sp. NPDC056731 TaxID=3155422 RepID=UPI0034146C7E
MGKDGNSGARRPMPAPPRVQRWFQERPSPFPHEQEALDHVKALMPQAEPFRSWATFSFTASSGRVNECDLFILVPRGLFLVELKAHPGRLVNNGSTWNFHGPDRLRTIDNPLHLTDLKSKELRSKLSWAAGKFHTGVRIPFISPAVFLSAPSLRSELDAGQQTNVYGRDDGASGLPRIWQDFLGLPPQRDSEAARRERLELARALPDLMKRIGVKASTAHLNFGDGWNLAGRPLDGGPTWEDRLAIREQPIREEGRVRVYLVSLQATAETRNSVERAARREYQVLQGISHRGIAQAREFRDHQGGPAILFNHRAADLRLDAYLATYGASLTHETRLELVRQIADALRYAHQRSLYHRALAARSVYVSSKSDGSNPVVRIIDWQVAARDFDSTSHTSLGTPSAGGDHVENAAQVYLAPEFEMEFADPVDLDIFGLGALAHLILAGEPPAERRSAMIERLTNDGGLRPSAVSDAVSEELDGLVFQATRADVAERLDSVDRFLDDLDRIEHAAATEASAPVGVDPLAAMAGQSVDPEWTVEKVLGTGATARALLVRREAEDLGGAIRVDRRVLKVALDETRDDRLESEADVLAKVGGGAVVRLLDGPRKIHNRTVLDLEYAGERSLGARLRGDGRLTYHELERFSSDLFTALDQLAGKGVWHRDLKPDNFGVLQRADRSWQLVLFDFSLAEAPERDVKAGTRGYLDPFLDTPRRPVFDSHAEYYAAAVTLHEMASGERPRWGDEMTDPRTTDDEYPVIAEDVFEPALKEGLKAFFRRALHRDADRRFDTLRQMHEAWQAVFSKADAVAPDDEDDETEDLEAARDRVAAQAETDTLLKDAGLSPRAQSVANSFDATTVGELLNVPLHQIARARGAGAVIRKELNRRHKQWTAKLRKAAAPAPKPAGGSGTAAVAPQVDLAELPADIAARAGIDELAAHLDPGPASKGSRKRDIIRLTLGLPGVDGALSTLPVWCSQTDIAKALDVSQATVSRSHVAAIQSWAADPVLATLREEIVAFVTGAGRVVTAQEAATDLRIRKGVREEDPQRAEALALAVVRAAVEAEAWPRDKDDDGQPRLAVLRRSGRVFIACESLAGTNDPSAPELADYARSLGQQADRLAQTEPLPDRAVVIRDLRSVPVPSGMTPPSDGRMVALASAAAQDALYSPRLELYPRGLGLAQAIRISQAAAGVRRDRGATAEELLAKVRLRFPDLDLGEPTAVELEEALAEAMKQALQHAGFVLEYDRETKRFRAPVPEGVRSMTASATATTLFPSAAGVAAASAAAGRDPKVLLGAKLEDALRRGGFLALTLRGKHLPGAADLIAQAYGVEPVSLGGLFLREFRALATQYGTEWERVLTIDTKFTESGELPRGLASYVKGAWSRVGEHLRERVETAGSTDVLFLHDAGLVARYQDAGGRELLVTLQNAARREADAPHGLWLLCPQEAPHETPQLDGMIVEVLGEAERAVLIKDFLDELRARSAAA